MLYFQYPMINLEQQKRAEALKSKLTATLKTFSSTPIDQRSELRKQLHQLKKEAEQELVGRTKGKEFLDY